MNERSSGTSGLLVALAILAFVVVMVLRG